MTKHGFLTGIALAAILLAPGLAMAQATDAASSGAGSSTTASESSSSGNLGFGTNSAGATVESINQASDNSFASIVGQTLKTSSNGSDAGQVTGMSFSNGKGFDFGNATQTGSSTGNDTGTATASETVSTHHHH
jgi:hypothetical protein